MSALYLFLVLMCLFGICFWLYFIAKILNDFVATWRDEDIDGERDRIIRLVESLASPENIVVDRGTVDLCVRAIREGV